MENFVNKLRRKIVGTEEKGPMTDEHDEVSRKRSSGTPWGADIGPEPPTEQAIKGTENPIHKLVKKIVK